jgi:hypothetical protein
VLCSAALVSLVSPFPFVSWVAVVNKEKPKEKQKKPKRQSKALPHSK